MKFVVNQVYPCSKVELGSELFYLCELGKYLQKDGHVLSLDGIVLDNCLKDSKYWSYLQVAHTNGWVVDVGCDFEPAQEPVLLSGVKNLMFTEEVVPFNSEDITKRRQDEEYDTYTPQLRQVIFSSKSDDVWEFGTCERSSDNSVNMTSLKDDLISQSWVSLTAYVMVNRLLTGSPKAFSLVLSADYTMLTLSFADMTLLLDETNALNGWCFADIGGDLRFSYEAWWFKYFDRGYLAKYYTPKEKFSEFKKLGLYKGDVVFLYTRNKCQQLNRVKSVSCCNYAIIREISNEGITFDVFYTLNTRYGQGVKFNKFPKELQKMYVDDSYRDCRHDTKSVAWIDLGVEYMLFDEGYFISSICKDDTLTIQDLSNSFEEKNFTLSCPEAIYWLFKDHQINFDEDKYLNKYFKNATPMYTSFKAGKL